MSAGRTGFGPQHFTPADPAFEKRVRGSFGRQRAMKTLGAELTSVSPGEVVIALVFREDLTQQHGYLHAAIITARYPAHQSPTIHIRTAVGLREVEAGM